MASGAGTSSLEKKTLLVGNAGMSSSLQPCDDFDVEKAGAAPVASTLRGGSAYHQVEVRAALVVASDEVVVEAFID